jgi:hypothetical protein
MNTSIVKKKRKSKKYIFTLHKNINTEKVDQKYGITIVSNISVVDDNLPENSTKLTELPELNNDASLDVISFLDETKRIYQCNISMIDFKNGQNVKYLKYNCFWCRNKFDSSPIGCPIQYISKKAIKNYYSEVSKDNYIIKENITKQRCELLNSESNFVFLPVKSSHNSSIDINQNEYYETDGIFCSFNCCKAFIKDNKHNKLYEFSDLLLAKLYQDMFNINNIVINPSPHWRLLQEYGGHLTIAQFRDNFNKTKFDTHGFIRNTDVFKPIASLYEEKLNF